MKNIFIFRIKRERKLFGQKKTKMEEVDCYQNRNILVTYSGKQ